MPFPSVEVLTSTRSNGDLFWSIKDAAFNLLPHLNEAERTYGAKAISALPKLHTVTSRKTDEVVTIKPGDWIVVCWREGGGPERFEFAHVCAIRQDQTDKREKHYDSKTAWYRANTHLCISWASPLAFGKDANGKYPSHITSSKLKDTDMVLSDWMDVVALDTVNGLAEPIKSPKKGKGFQVSALYSNTTITLCPDVWIGRSMRSVHVSYRISNDGYSAIADTKTERQRPARDVSERPQYPRSPPGR